MYQLNTFPEKYNNMHGESLHVSYEHHLFLQSPLEFTLSKASTNLHATSIVYIKKH
jgi:hypothetical protein